MSTKATIAYGENFHFYYECFDTDHVYLQLENMSFEASTGQVTVAIPIDVWETIRCLAPARLELIEASDDELRSIVERQVDERIAKYEQIKTEHPDRAGLFAFFGSLVFGGADRPRGEQIKRGLEHYTRERERQQSVAQRMAEHRKVEKG